jgi:hypothetical protein
MLEECLICVNHKENNNFVTLHENKHHRLCEECYKSLNAPFCPFCRCSIVLNTTLIPSIVLEGDTLANWNLNILRIQIGTDRFHIYEQDPYNLFWFSIIVTTCLIIYRND